MLSGFVKLSRDIMYWEWYQSSNVSRLFIHLVLKANFKDNKWQGQLIKRGQLVTSINHIAVELRLSVQAVRTAFDKLDKSGCVKLKTTNRFTLVTVVNYDFYQSKEAKSNKQRTIPSTNQQQSDDEQIKTTKERKKKNNDNNERIELTRDKFKKQVFEHTQYDIKILNTFYDYWSELSQNKSKMRFEEERYFEIDKRLKKWFSNERGNEAVKNTNTTLSNR